MDEAGLRIEVQRCPQGGLRFVEPAIYRTAQAEKAPAGAAQWIERNRPAQELERFVRAPEYAGEARNPAQHVGVVWRESQCALQVAVGDLPVVALSTTRPSAACA